MSLFDPLYQIEVKEPPSLAEITKHLSEFDGSGSGLMTARQTFAACKEISDIGFNDAELQQYVKEGLDVAGDGSGRIKLDEFAPYLAFEAKKKYKKSSAKQKDKSQPANDAYINPFTDFASDPQPKPTPKKMLSATKITITPDPSQKGKPGGTQTPVDMKGSYSPTESDPTDLPQWFGHSVNTIEMHPNQPSVDDPFAFFNNDDDDDDMKTNKAPKPHHISVATQDILFADDDTNSSSSAVINQRNLSPTKTRQKKSKHAISQSTTVTGLIAPPRSKGDRSRFKKRKKGGKHGATLSGSFMNTFGDLDDFSAQITAKTKAKHQLKLKKAHSEIALESNNKLPTKATEQVSTPTPNGTETKAANNAASVKKKRPKIDAIVVMKRGAAMLKYGRRGFPHFRRFQISHDLTKLLWYSRKKSLGETHVAIPDMKDILDGQQTEVFKQCTQKTLVKASFSIIYGAKLKSLDVVAKSSEEAALWIKGLKGLIKANQQGKLHKVMQILVDVDFKDISKTKYRQCSDDERRKYDVQHRNRPELVHTIATTLQQSRKIFQSLVKISASNNIQNSNEYENVQTLTSEIEERLEEIEFGLQNKTADLTDLKRDVWVLKVDVTVLEEKAKVLSKIKTAIPI